MEEQYKSDVFTSHAEPVVPFKLYKCYEKPGSVEILRCNKCNTDKLEVGIGSHFTVARCPQCGHEECIHDG